MKGEIIFSVFIMVAGIAAIINIIFDGDKDDATM